MLESPGPRIGLRHLSCHCCVPFSAAACPEASIMHQHLHNLLGQVWTALNCFALPWINRSLQSWSHLLLSSHQNITEKADQFRKWQAKQSSADTLLRKSKTVILQPLLSWVLQHQAQLSPCFYFYFNNCLAAASAGIAEELSSPTNQREKLACLPRVPGGDAAGVSPQTHLIPLPGSDSSHAAVKTAPMVLSVTYQKSALWCFGRKRDSSPFLLEMSLEPHTDVTQRGASPMSCRDDQI